MTRKISLSSNRDKRQQESHQTCAVAFGTHRDETVTSSFGPRPPTSAGQQDSTSNGPGSDSEGEGEGTGTSVDDPLEPSSPDAVSTNEMKVRVRDSASVGSAGEVLGAGEVGKTGEGRDPLETSYHLSH